MIKCFLSHSSKDKDSYVSIVAEKLGANNIIYDELSFEVGMPTLDEIVKGLEKTQLFVIFISENSLNSSWVQKEHFEAKERLNSQKIKQIYPIIIDKRITYSDSRIPSWMKDEYNLKLVTRPVVAVRKIRQRLRELSWQYHPHLEQLRQIFVGRNEQIKLFEERLDDFDLQKPTCVTATGLKKIGRRTLLCHALIKTNLISSSYQPPIITLSRYESIEDFILKLNDLGLSRPRDLTNLTERTLDEKIKLSVSIIKEIQDAKEILFILDNGCIVNYNRDFGDWFKNIVIELSSKEYLTFAVASSWRPLITYIKHNPFIFVLDVPELTIKERKGLLKRYLDLEGINLSSDDFNFFSGLLYGFPEQIAYTISLIKELGISETKRHSYLIQEYNTEHARVVIQSYKDNDQLDFIYLLSQFEIISLDFLFEIAPEEKYRSLLQELIAKSIVDTVGIEREFVRLNDTIRDYISRNRFGIPNQFKKKLNRHLKVFIEDSQKYERDISDYQFSIKQALLEGKDVPSEYLIPSHFLATMRELYNNRQHYDRVIELADKILQKKESLHATIRESIQYYLCLALARKKYKRFLSEVQNIKGPEHNFLLGFYYRLVRRDDDALSNLQKALEHKITAVRARRELVQVYILLEEYEKAIKFAKQNYDDNRDNPYHIQAYFNCLVNLHYSEEEKHIAKQLIDKLEEIGSNKSREMSRTSYAMWLARCENDYEAAMDAINDAIATFPRSPYPLITKFNIQLFYKDIQGMKSTIREMKNALDEKAIYKDTYWRLYCLYLAHIGESKEAISLVKQKLNEWPYSARRKLIYKIEQIAQFTLNNWVQ